MIAPDGSSSQRRRPWTAERGKAWWLWCQASPREASESHQTLVEWSSVAKRRRPWKWQIELIDQVMWWTKKIRTSPPQSSPVSAPASVPVSSQPSANGIAEREPDEGDEAAVEQPHPAVVHQVGRVLAPVGLAVGVEQPADVRVPEPGEAAAVADVGGVRVALLVGVGVVLAVVGDPVDHRALDRHRAGGGERVLERLVGLEGAVGEHAVVADRDPDRGDQIHRRERSPGRSSRPRWFHSRTIAARVATKGRTTADDVGVALESAHVGER